MRRARVLWAVALVSVMAVVVGMGVRRQNIELGDAIIDPGGRTLYVETGTCGQDAAATVEETATTVTVTATADPRYCGGPVCDDAVKVELEKPLGTRAFIDGQGGDRIDTYSG